MSAILELPSRERNWEFYRSDKELRKSRRRTEEWTVPALRMFYGNRTGTRVLSVGCGNAVDVAVLRERGYACWGVDIDGTCHADARRSFVQANARFLPFAANIFDATLCLETFEHVGAPVGVWKPCRQYRIERKRFVAELLRVTKPGGVVLIVTPNRLFPVDEHGPGRTGLRWHTPYADMTVSCFELRRLFFPTCQEFGVLPYGRYFELEKVERLAGRLAVRFVRLLLPLFSNRFIHCSPLGPHLFVYFRKAGGCTSSE